MNEDQRRKRILNIILIGSIAMLVALDGIVLYYSIRDRTAYHEISFELFSVLPLLFIFLYALSRRGFSKLSSYLLIGAYLASNSYAAYRWGVTLQTVILTYALIIIVATILLGARSGFIITGTVGAFIIPLWYLQFHGIIPMQKQQLRVADAIIFAILYFLIMIVAWLYNREIEKSLLLAERSEATLKEERDMLEVKVEERTNELRLNQVEKMEQLNRFAELGRLSSGLFHDILNLLNALSLREGADPTDPALTHAFATATQIEHFTAAIRKQIDHRDVPVAYSLDEAVAHAIQLIGHKARKGNTRILFEGSGKVETITYSGIPFKFHQIIFNLLLNGIESYDGLPKDDGRIRTVTISLDRREDGMIMLRVTDNGCGIPSAIIPKIFDLFFTTKDEGKGMGIGLAAIKKIIDEDFHGEIIVESDLHKGSIFTVLFPTNYGQPQKRGGSSDNNGGDRFYRKGTTS